MYPDLVEQRLTLRAYIAIYLANSSLLYSPSTPRNNTANYLRAASCNLRKKPPRRYFNLAFYFSSWRPFDLGDLTFWKRGQHSTLRSLAS